MIWPYKILILAIIVIVLFVLLIYATTRLITYPNFYHPSMEIPIKDLNNENHNPLNYKQLDFVMNDGYVIHGTMILNQFKSNKFLIYTHGWANNRLSGLKYMDPYLDEGYNFYMYDLRGCGENENYLISMGENESSDLLQIIRALKESYDYDISISLHGESLGGFSSLLVLKDCPFIKFCLTDSAYTSIENVIKTILKRSRIPLFIYNPLQLYVKLRFHFNFNNYNALESVNHSSCPLLIINGTDDTTVTKQMSQEIYDASISLNKKVYYFDGAGHIQSQKSNPERYQKVVSKFLKLIKLN
jgi:fermentation-respiration switch protein FrsA (DUF1100 family)